MKWKCFTEPILKLRSPVIYLQKLPLHREIHDRILEKKLYSLEKANNGIRLTSINKNIIKS